LPDPFVLPAAGFPIRRGGKALDARQSRSDLEGKFSVALTRGRISTGISSRMMGYR
jgi:hypothetical protein